MTNLKKIHLCFSVKILCKRKHMMAFNAGIFMTAKEKNRYVNEKLDAMRA